MPTIGAMLPQGIRTALIEHFVSALDFVARRRSRIKSPAHLILGEQGEDAAFFHLLRQGYTVTARRWSAGNLSGDVDLIAWQGDLLCIVEVKTRTKRNQTPAHAAVDQHKRRILHRLARAYLRQLRRAVPPNVRFDVISVYLTPGRKPEIEHFENAFGWSEQRDRYEG
jgi:putative endonuclease